MGISKINIEPLTQARVLETLPPFPIVLVSTRLNIITIGQIAHFTFNPLRIGIGVAHSRYSYVLLKKEGEFVINVPGCDLIDAVKICGSVSGRTTDKFQEAKLTREKSEKVQSSIIGECGANIECRIEQEIVFADRTWFIGLVLAARKHTEHLGNKALLCNRGEYIMPGDIVAER